MQDVSDDGLKRPSVAVYEQGDKHQKKSCWHQKPHLSAQNGKVFVEQCDYELPAGLQCACEYHKGDTNTEYGAVKSRRKYSGAEAEKQDGQAVDERHSEGEPLRHSRRLPALRCNFFFCISRIHHATSHL